MNVRPEDSIYQEADDATEKFDPLEIEKLRLLLRRLRFLETKVQENGGLSGVGGGSAWAELEMHATAWILDDVGYLRERVA